MLDWLLALYLPFTTISSGLDAGGTTISAAALACVAGIGVIVWKRLDEQRAPLSWDVLKQPAVISALIYMLIGIGSGLFAADKDRYAREVIQRTLIILMPMYLFIFGARTPQAIARSLIWMVLAATGIAAVAIVVGAKSGFHIPVYLPVAHKNLIGADCAHGISICAAFLLTRQMPRYRKHLWIAIAILALGDLAAQARAALLGCILGMFLMMFAIKVRLRYQIIVGALLAVSVAAAAITLPQEVIERAVSNERYSSNGERKVVWELMWKKLSKDPFMCVGWGNNLPIVGETTTLDAASIFFYDWGQMSFLGVLAHWGMFITSLFLSVWNARHIQRFTLLSAINLSAMGIMVARFEQSYLDSFWIGRGATLAAWAAVGIAVWVNLYIKQLKKADQSRLVGAATAGSLVGVKEQ